MMSLREDIRLNAEKMVENVSLSLSSRNGGKAVDGAHHRRGKRVTW